MRYPKKRFDSKISFNLHIIRMYGNHLKYFYLLLKILEFNENEYYISIIPERILNKSSKNFTFQFFTSFVLFI